ncbi:MAG: hypothetical protein QOG80_3265 [Pseudonocardiales bacterium]|jgi:hypothetical protein|nr:hypothetical protein [Pseudonocardiales bacterium]
MTEIDTEPPVGDTKPADLAEIRLSSQRGGLLPPFTS